MRSSSSSRLTIHSRYHKRAGHGRRIYKGEMGRPTCRNSMRNGRRWRSRSRVSQWQCNGKCLVGLANFEGVDKGTRKINRQSEVPRVIREVETIPYQTCPYHRVCTAIRRRHSGTPEGAVGCSSGDDGIVASQSAFGALSSTRKYLISTICYVQRGTRTG